ncbi:MAG: hypothetical protein QXM75_01080 [Candidatus Diapherotrites archaeon]
MTINISPEVELFMLASSITVIFGLFSYFFRKKFVGEETLKKLKEKSKEARELIRKNDPSSKERLDKLNTELVEINLNLMKASMPLIILSSVFSLVILLPILNERYSGYSFPIFGHWIWYYFVASLLTSALLQQLLKRFE